MRIPTDRRRALLASLVLAGLVIVIYGRFLQQPETFFIGDLVNLFQPLRHHYREALSHGQLPLWTPALLAGTPTVADPQAATFYPGTLIHLLVSYPLSELISFLLHLLLGGTGMLWLARRLGLGWAPALLAATSFAGGGFLAAHLVHPNFVHSAAWVGWILGGVHCLVHRPSLRHGILVAATTGLCLLAGGLQVAYYGLGMAVVLAIAWSVRRGLGPEGSRGLRAALLPGGLVAGALLLGALLAAVQLLPSLEFVPLSVRSDGVTLELARSYRVSQRNLLALLAPYLFGLPGRTPYLGGQPFYEAFGYAGVLLAPLSLTAVVARRDPLRWLLAAMGALALLAALGPDAPLDLHRWLWGFLPGFDSFRAHGRLLFVVVLAGSLLAAFGLQDLLGADARTRRRARWSYLTFTLAALALLGGALLATGEPPDRWPPDTLALGRRSALGAAAALVGGWLLLGPGASRGIPARRLAAGLIAIHVVDLAIAGRFLVANRHPPAGVDIAREAHRPPPVASASLPAQRRVLLAADTFYMLQNAGVMLGFHNVRGYGPMMLRRTYELLHLADHGRFPRWRRLPVDQNLISVRRAPSPVLRLLGVGAVLRHDRPATSARERTPLRWRVRALPDPLPRSFAVYRTRLVGRREERARQLERFDPGRIALVEREAAALPEGPAQPPTEVPVIRRSRGGGRIVLAPDLPRAGMVIFTESWYPGWEARVNGRRAEVYRVDHALMGVKVPAGRHRVTLSLSPAGLLPGAWISLVAWLLVILLSVSAARRQKRYRKSIP